MASVNYIRICEYENEEILEIPVEPDNTILLSTLTAQFPKCTGLKYKSESGAMRGARLSDGKIFPPEDGWNTHTFLCVFPKNDVKRKIDEENEEVSTKLKRLEGRKCTDLIVLNLPWRTEEKDLKAYFSTYGELVTAQVKRDPQTHQSKGYGFIRFSNYESQVLCLAESHFIDGRWCDVKIPMSKAEGDKQEVGRKIHVGRITEDITTDEIRMAFSKFGRILDVFVPKPFRAFAFVTFDDPDVAANLLGKEVEITPQCVSIVGSAVPKLPPTSSASHRHMAVAMQAAAYMAALNQSGALPGWPALNGHENASNAQYVRGNQSNQNSASNPLGYNLSPSATSAMFGNNPTAATAAALAAQYTRAQRQVRVMSQQRN